jgi:exoribonuclease-2
MENFDGQLVEYFEGDELQFGFVEKHVGSHVNILNLKGRQVKFASNRVILSHGKSNTRDFVKLSSVILEDVESIKAEFDITLLWEMVAGESTAFTLDQLADIYYSDATSRQKSALIRAIREDNIHFKLKSLLFTPRNEEQIEQIRINLKANEQKEEELTNLRNLLYRIAKAEEYSPDQNEQQILKEIYQAHFSWQEYRYKDELKQYSKSMEDKEIICELLTKTGFIKPGTDHFISLAGIKPEFTADQLAAADSLKPYTSDHNRVNLNHPLCFSIDDAGTVEIDDAISMKLTDDTIEIGIHIADVRSFIAKDSILDKSARYRGSTIYLETGSIPMFPERLSSDYSSLTANEPRPVITFLITCSRSSYEILNKQILCGEVTVKDKLTYILADEYLTQPSNEIGDALTLIEQVCLKLREKRFEKGAIEILKPEIQFKVEGEEVVLTNIDRWSRSRRLIGELMILINNLAGEFCVEHEIPVIYRVQEEPAEEVAELGDLEKYDPVITDKLIRFIRPSRLSSIPQKHSGLGLEVYTQLSSPIRRFADLVIQRQVACAVEGITLPYTGEELFQILAEVEETLKTHKSLYQDSGNYWFMKYLEKYCRDNIFPATAVYENNGKVTFELDVYGKRTTLNVPDSAYALGERVDLKISKIDPEKGILKFIID